MDISSSREGQLVEVFTVLADTLTADYDVLDLLQVLVDNCVSLFDVEAAGILLADGDGVLDVVASTSEASRLVEVMQIDAQSGPCFDCFETGASVVVADIAEGPVRWNRFRERALELGFRGVLALPLRLRGDVIGTLNLLRVEVGELAPRDVRAAQALADVATIGVLHERNLRESGLVREQLQRALDSRVVIEQAKGVVSHTNGVSLEDAFGVLRGYARAHHRLLSEVAAEVVAQTLRI